MLGNSWVTIFFRVLNFSVLIGVAFYLFRKYFKSKLEEKITQKEMLLKGLEEQGYFLEGKVHTLELYYDKQEQKAADLKQKIAEWNSSIAAENNKLHQEYQLHMQQISDRIKIKNETIALSAWRRQVLPELTMRVQEALRQKFKDSSYAYSYVHEIVCRLERK